MNLTGNELLQVFEALANPHRMRIVSSLREGRKYVSELAREVRMSRPLLYMHLHRMEIAGLVSARLELSDDGKAKKYYELTEFELLLTPDAISDAVRTLTDKNAAETSTLEEE
ncbi:ArsR family transcriptional regulator [Cohnella endophytica]|uniref:ArsR family transcriptional regulator n=1 Tax=Cohnella endophytica TaxID=2419778 RepID=A0A494XLT0_9BACL|nr:winged helix-turn-helix domain-containing protein [Cohnella endophytica]RKP51655.1 ArsR family transcriptional regulator [Cohnella endophytica]